MGLKQLFGHKGFTNRTTRERNGAWRPRLERLEGREVPSVAYTINSAGDALLKFDTAATTVTTSVNVSGLSSGEILDGLAFRTQTGQLFAVALNASTNTARLGTINLETNTFTPIGASFTISGTNLTLTDN